MSATRPASRAQTPEPGTRNNATDNPGAAGVRDNIKVSVRIRPLSDKESSRGDRAVWGTDGSGGVGLLGPGPAAAAAASKLDVKFAYDVVFSPSNSNGQVFDEVAWPVVEPVLQGISGTVFAYGVTSSGKTHTMIGTPSDAGIVPRAIQALFDRIDKAEDSVYTVKLSMMEIYCEMLNDLLDPSKLNLDVQECQGAAGRGSVLVVKGLTEGKVASAQEALALIQQGQDNRKVASTAFNDQSSRSHTICRLLVESSPRRNNTTTTTTLHSSVLNSCAAAAGAADTPNNSSGSVSRSGSFTAAGAANSNNNSCTSAWLTLVDLAGSEGARAALSKDQQAEARDINRSLLTLGKVMYELAKGTSGGFLPFRDSLLTRLLKPSLTGVGAKVAIICNVTPASSQSDETWNTLRFADGAKRIKITAVKNEALDIAAVVAQYQREVAALKAQLAALSGAAASASGGNLSADVLHAIQQTLDSSSKDNAAEQLQDQAAQLQYLRECLSFASRERDQLLVMNKKMTAMLVRQVQQQSSACSAATAGGGSGCDAAVSGEGDGRSADASVTAGAGSSGGAGAGDAGAGLFDGGSSRSSNSKAGRRFARLRRCLSYESLRYYGEWRGSGSGSDSDGSSITPQQQQAHPSGFEEPGLECNAADAAEVQQLLRITGDELPEFVTHGPPEQQQGQQLQPPETLIGSVLPDSRPSSTKATHMLGATAAAAGMPSSSAGGGGGSAGGSSVHRIPPVLSMYYSAVSSFGGLSSSSGTDGSSGGSGNGAAGSFGGCGTAGAGAGGAVLPPVLPCPIVFTGSRRTSKTLAVAVPGCAAAAGGGGSGVKAAGWLGYVGLPVLPEGVVHTGLTEVVEAHKQLAAQEGRLELLLQQLADKEELLEQARQLQQGEVLQLRLTITAADRALLRDKLAETEQQLASYRAQQEAYEQDLHEVVSSAEQLYLEHNQTVQERDALAAQLQVAVMAAQQASTTSAAAAATNSLGTDAAATAALMRRGSFSRCSSVCTSPEPGQAAAAAGGGGGMTRIPQAPGTINHSSSSISPTRAVVTYGGSPSPPPPGVSSRGSGAVSAGGFRSVGSPRHKSAAAAATLGSIQAMLSADVAAGSIGGAGIGPSQSSSSSSSSNINTKSAGGAGAAAVNNTLSANSFLSPRLSKLGSNLTPLVAAAAAAGDGGGGNSGVVSVQPLSSSSTTIGSLRPSTSPCPSPRTLSRSNSLLARQTGGVLQPPAGGGKGVSVGGALASSPSAVHREGRERDSKLRASWGAPSTAATTASSSGPFNPICITSPFNSEQSIAATAAAAREPPVAIRSREQRISTTSTTAGGDNRILRRSTSGTLSSPRQQRPSSTDGRRTGATYAHSALVSGGSTILVQQQQPAGNKQSRIPLPPFLKRHSKRLLEMQQGAEEGSSGNNGTSNASTNSSSSGISAQHMDRFLLGLHGQHVLPAAHEQLSSAHDEQPAAQQQQYGVQSEGAAGKLPSAGPQRVAGCAKTVPLLPLSGASPTASPFAVVAAGAGCSDHVAKFEEDAQAAGASASPDASPDGAQSVQSVRSHPLALPQCPNCEHIVAGWSARSSEVSEVHHAA